MDNYANMMMNV